MIITLVALLAVAITIWVWLWSKDNPEQPPEAPADLPVRRSGKHYAAYREAWDVLSEELEREPRISELTAYVYGRKEIEELTHGQD